MSWIEDDGADSGSADDDKSFWVMWWKSELHFVEQMLRTCVVKLNGYGCRCGVMHVNKLEHGFGL